MRRIVLLIIIASILLNGCGKNDRFKVVERYGVDEIIVDTETGIGYLHYGYGISPLYDADGELYRPNGWRDD